MGAVADPGQPAAVVDQKATAASEFVGLLGKHLDHEFLAGEIGVGQVVGIDRIDVVEVAGAFRRLAEPSG